MNKVNPRGYLGRQDWLWWALTTRGLDGPALPHGQGETHDGSSRHHGPARHEPRILASTPPKAPRQDPLARPLLCDERLKAIAEKRGVHHVDNALSSLATG